MKKRFMILLALLLTLICVAASAQEYYTLPEIREQAAAGWHETYTDKYGRETTVDIDVQVFGEDKAPVLKLGFTDVKEILYNHNNPYDTVTNIKRKGELRTQIYLSYNQQVDLDRAYGEKYGNDLTLRDMYGFMSNILQHKGIKLGGVFFDQPDMLQVICSTKQATGEVGAAAFYYVQLWQKIREIPIITHAMGSFKKYSWPILEPGIQLQMRNQDEYSVFAVTLVEEETIAEDIPLCSIDRVISNLEEKIEAGNIQRVLSLRFGYSLFNDPNFPKGKRSAYDAEYYYAVPSWVIDCIYMEKGKETYSVDESMDSFEDKYITNREANEFRRLTINAQTGELLEYYDKSKNGAGNADYMGFIPWSEVQ